MGTKRWSEKRAADWYAEQPWLVGCNYIPSTAINQLEMWQGATYDTDTIARELTWAAELGFNTVRVYLHDLAWQDDPHGFVDRIDRFLEIAIGRGIRPLFVLFDDCWNQNPAIGKQPEPAPGVHNSGWVQSPGSAVVRDTSTWSRLKAYVSDILTAFGRDERVLMWDLYNEPGNNDLGRDSLPLLTCAFAWARGVDPSQPVTAGLWSDDGVLNRYLRITSDVITFHNYSDADNLSRQIETLKAHGKPLLCTEYMARTRDSRFETHLPIFKREKVGCLNWGLVSGKTQTIYPWGSKAGGPEPELWFHDILRPDGAPYRQEEVSFIKSLTLGSAVGE